MQSLFLSIIFLLFFGLIVLFSLYFSYIVFFSVFLRIIVGLLLAIFDSPKDQNLFFESATLFCMCPLGVLMMDDDSWSQGNQPL